MPSLLPLTKIVLVSNLGTIALGFNRNTTWTMPMTSSCKSLIDSRNCGLSSRVFFKDSNIILKYSILGDCSGLKKHVNR